jgi:transcriptional regulator with XRE-family HTH domain
MHSFRAEHEPCCELAGRVMKWRPELARRRTARDALGRATSADLVARASKSIHGSPSGSRQSSPPSLAKGSSPAGDRADRAEQLRHRLGARIRALRDARGLTQETIADRIEVTPKYVSQLECGQRSPSWETLIAIAHHGFEMKLAALMFGIDEEIGSEVQDLSDMLAGRPKETRRDLLQAMQLMLRAGTGPK